MHKKLVRPHYSGDIVVVPATTFARQLTGNESALPSRFWNFLSSGVFHPYWQAADRLRAAVTFLQTAGVSALTHVIDYRFNERLAREKWNVAKLSGSSTMLSFDYFGCLMHVATIGRNGLFVGLGEDYYGEFAVCDGIVYLQNVRQFAAPILDDLITNQRRAEHHNLSDQAIVDFFSLAIMFDAAMFGDADYPMRLTERGAQLARSLGGDRYETPLEIRAALKLAMPHAAELTGYDEIDRAIVDMRRSLVSESLRTQKIRMFD